ncbi:alpha/beta hydrolase [Stieleria sp. JC731]|uniref:alpha/beta hydrolase n=1 Tax=Pirellulaceae TaxID=2691357 RepID=UPI001E3B69E9|nr:alpha/beta hydrolase [Stieleria sp. JC731]MCC9600883.1 alpha/beta hydrolase [Stieleria sp. JC731]
MTLHPQAKAYLENVAQQGRPGWHELTVAESRTIFQSLAPLCGPRPTLRRIENLQTDSGIKLRLYSDVPAEQSTDAPPVLMFFHGGGWVLGGLDTHDGLCRRLAKHSGCAVVAVDYGLSPENPFPGPVHDCFDATAWICEHQQKLAIDGSRLALVGDSAGGYLATTVAMMAQQQGSPAVDLQVLIYPVIEANFETASYQSFAEGYGLTRETMKWFWKHFLSGTDPAEASLMDRNGLSDLPTAFVITAEYDVLRDEGIAFAKRLSDSNVEVDLWRIEGMLHGFVHFAGVFDPGIEVIRQLGEQVGRRLKGISTER